MHRVFALIAAGCLAAQSLPRSARADVIEVDHYPVSPLSIVLTGPAGSDAVVLTGPLTQEVQFEGAFEGDASDDDGNSRDEVATRLTLLSLSGTSALYGPIALSLSPSLASIGVIEETTDIATGRLDVRPFAPGGTADSAADLFFVFQLLVPGEVFHNADPLPLHSVISYKPHGPTEHFVISSGVELLDKRGLPSGYWINRPIPEPGTLALVAGGLVGLSALSPRAGRSRRPSAAPSPQAGSMRLPPRRAARSR